MAAKGALQRAAQALGIKPSLVREVSKTIVDSLDEIKITKDNKNWIELAKGFEGLISNTSVHASAVLVFPSDPTDFCAIEKKGDTMIAAYDYHELEELGLAKVDVLGLKNMDIIEDVVQTLKAEGVDFDLDRIPLDDKKTSELLCKGDTNGVFQVESRMMKGIIKGIQPKGFKDMVAVVALGRPAPLQLGIVDRYIERRKEYLKEKGS